MNSRIFSIILFLLIAVSCDAQMSNPTSPVEGLSQEEVQPNFVRDEFLVNVRVFEFDSNKLDPWIEGITHLRAFGVDFRKGKGSDGQYQYVDDSKMDEFIAFCKKKNLKVIWTLNLTSFTMEKEMAYVRDLFSKGLNIVGFQYGGEFWLKKYAFGELQSKGVVERIRMDGANRDYLDLLDNWMPVVFEEYPLGDYLHILVTASTTEENNRTQNYRREFNQKVFNYVTSNPELKGKVDFSYHLYAGDKPDMYKSDEEDVITPERVSWGFIAKKPSDSRWIVTESGYYTKTWSDEDLAEAREFYTLQSQKLGKDDIMGIHVLYIADQGQNNLALYNLNGRTRVGDNIELWLNNSVLPASDTSNSETEEDEMSESASNSPEPTTSPSTAPVFGLHLSRLW